jgi:hypothetical protein
MQPALSTMHSEEDTQVCSSDSANGNKEHVFGSLGNDGLDILPGVDMDFVGYESPGQDGTSMRFHWVSYLPTFL